MDTDDGAWTPFGALSTLVNVNVAGDAAGGPYALVPPYPLPSCIGAYTEWWTLPSSTPLSATFDFYLNSTKVISGCQRSAGVCLTDHMGIDVDNRQVLISGGKYQLKVVTKVGAANYTRTMLDNYEVLSECQTNVGCDKVDSLMSNTIAYNPVFSPGAVVDGATYMVCPGTTMYAKDLSEYTFLSEDGVIWSQLPYLIGWTYLAGVKKNISYNGMGVDPTVNRTDVIGSSSRTVGTRVYPVTTGLISRSGGISSPYTKNEMTIYTFDERATTQCSSI